MLACQSPSLSLAPSPLCWSLVSLLSLVSLVSADVRGPGSNCALAPLLTLSRPSTEPGRVWLYSQPRVNILSTNIKTNNFKKMLERNSSWQCWICPVVVCSKWLFLLSLFIFFSSQYSLRLLTQHQLPGRHRSIADSTRDVTEGICINTDFSFLEQNWSFCALHV